MSDRAAFLRSALRDRLETQPDRLGWLREQLENYVERWLGFTADPSLSIKGLLRDDFFIMLSVATELYGAERENIDSRVGDREWRQFVETLRRIEKTKDRSLAAELLPMFRRYQAVHASGG
ncbi:MAG: hypothetical protein JNN01_11885 [Opitutaceae bacterium]|nr:hypothetical protein [Opitutaceae bacterium]